jgi:hypothetical protein
MKKKPSYPRHGSGALKRVLRPFPYCQRSPNSTPPHGAAPPPENHDKEYAARAAPDPASLICYPTPILHLGTKS